MIDMFLIMMSEGLLVACIPSCHHLQPPQCCFWHNKICVPRESRKSLAILRQGYVGSETPWLPLAFFIDCVPMYRCTLWLKSVNIGTTPRPSIELCKHSALRQLSLLFQSCFQGCLIVLLRVLQLPCLFLSLAPTSLYPLFFVW